MIGSPKQVVALLMSDVAATGFTEYYLPFRGLNGSTTWKDTEYVINPDRGAFDGVVVLQSVSALDRSFEIICPPTKTLLVCLEPPDIVYLPTGYTRQCFATISQDDRIRSRRSIKGYSAHGWFVEVPIEGLLKIA